MGVLGFGVAAHAREKRARVDAQARAQELESAGAKLAHDLNNALYAVRGSVEILALRAGRDPDVMKFSDMARRNTDRCAGLVELFVERLSIASQPVEPEGHDARPLLADPVQTNAAMLELTAKPAQDPKIGP
jgi:signal transduction histidine kinase